MASINTILDTSFLIVIRMFLYSAFSTKSSSLIALNSYSFQSITAEIFNGKLEVFLILFAMFSLFALSFAACFRGNEAGFLDSSYGNGLSQA
jgi:hypothetical protein